MFCGTALPDAYLHMLLLTLQTSPPRLGMRSTIDLASHAACFHGLLNEESQQAEFVVLDCRWKPGGG